MTTTDTNERLYRVMGLTPCPGHWGATRWGPHPGGVSASPESHVEWPCYYPPHFTSSVDAIMTDVWPGLAAKGCTYVMRSPNVVRPNCTVLVTCWPSFPTMNLVSWQGEESTLAGALALACADAHEALQEVGDE